LFQFCCNEIQIEYKVKNNAWIRAAVREYYYSVGCNSAVVSNVVLKYRDLAPQRKSSYHCFSYENAEDNQRPSCKLLQPVMQSARVSDIDA
jgi:hypothetical protein